MREEERWIEKSHPPQMSSFLTVLFFSPPPPPRYSCPAQISALCFWSTSTCIHKGFTGAKFQPKLRPSTLRSWKERWKFTVSLLALFLSLSLFSSTSFLSSRALVTTATMNNQMRAWNLKHISSYFLYPLLLCELHMQRGERVRQQQQEQEEQEEEEEEAERAEERVWESITYFESL